jgi:hypothetical protein
VSFITNHTLFIIIFGISGGLCQGGMIVLPIYCAWRYFKPEYKSYISGIIISAFALAPFFTSILCVRIMNPENKKATIEVINGKSKTYLFEQEIALRVPSLFRYLALFTLVLGVLGILLIYEPAEDISESMDYEDNMLQRKNSSPS